MKSSTSVLALAGAMILIPGPALAQDSPQTIPGVGNFSLPSSTPTPRPTPTPGPPSIPNAVPIPTLTPALPERSTAAPAATPIPTPTPSRPEQLRLPPVATSTSRTSQTPRAAPLPAPPATAPSSNATPTAPPTEATPPPESVAPSVAASPTPTATATPGITAPPAETTSGGAIGWISGLIALAAAAAGLFFWRRTRAEPVDWQEPIVEAPTPPQPVPRPKTAPVPPPTPAPATPTAPRFLERASPANAVAAETASRPWIDLSIAPRRAGLNLVTATADVGVTLRNSGAVVARNVRIDVRLLSARAGQEGELGTLFATPIARTVTPAFDLAPGTEKTTRALATLLRDDINVLKAAGRPMFVPIVAINVLYDRGDGGTGQTAAAYAIGIERVGAEKLGPFWLDQPNAMHETLGQRPHALSLRS